MAGWTTLKASGSIPPARCGTPFMDDGVSAFIYGGTSTDKQGEPETRSDMFQLSVDGKPVWKAIKPQGDEPGQREGHSVTYVGGLFFLFAGSNGEKEFNDLHSFDPKTFTWKLSKPLGTAPGPRLNHTATAVGHYIFVFGGFMDGVACKDLYKFDTKTLKWSAPLKEAPTARCYHSCVAFGNKLFVFGGRDGPKKLFNDVQIYDTISNTWTAPAVIGNPPDARDFHTAVAIGDKMVVFGGSQDTQTTECIFYNDVHTFDTETMTWVKLALPGSAPPVRFSHASFVRGNQMYIFGGTGADGNDLDDLHVLQTEIAVQSKTSADKLTPVRPPPLKSTLGAGGAPQKPAVPPAPSAAAAAAIATPAPAPTPAPAAAAAAATAAPAAAAAAVTAATTTKPNINYDVPTPVPSTRKVVKAETVAAVQPRDYAEKQTEITRTIDGIFGQIKTEFQQIDDERAKLNADKAAFAQEKAENEALYAKQQKELQDLHAAHKKETEEWLEARRKENDAELKRIADQNAALASAKDQHAKAVDVFNAEKAEFAKKEAALDERAKKMEAIMAQFKGIA